ncbi:DUF3445 domain-containing protein [Ahrensia kielensis]|uniref:DUF3445 domain-containing protein n=1 Tax=Ahrensia kielensis TaxID=76980 RepID=A0ABU9T6Q0_9HYPH
MRDRSSQLAALPKAFEIGVAPTTRDAQWLRPFEGMGTYLTEKSRLLACDFDLVFADIGGTDDGQRQVLELVSEHLLKQFPETYLAAGDDIVVTVDEAQFNVPIKTAEAPLITASKLLADDLVIMRKSNDGWQLACGCVCFPSAWNVRQKIGKIMSDVHAPVPDFAQGSRKATIIERMFDALQIGATVERYNWSLHSVDDLHLPEPEDGDFLDMDDLARLFFRGEVQTLTKLPSGSDILFTIGVYVDPLDVLRRNSELIGDLNMQLMALKEEQLDYKGLRGVRDRLHGHLNSMG